MTVLPLFAAQQSLFRAYDIRGDQQYFTVDFIHALGEAFAQLYTSQSYDVQGENTYHHNTVPNSTVLNNAESTHQIKDNTVVIGYDVRCGSDTIAQTLATILQQYGLTVIHLGLITTPMMAFWAQHYAGHGIMVTASHSAKDTLGIKWLVANTSPSSLAIQQLYQQLYLCHTPSNAAFKPNNSAQDNINNKVLPAGQITTTYIDAMVSVFNRIHTYSHQNNKDDSRPLCKTTSTPLSKTDSKLPLTIVIDCLNGATSNIAHPLFERFCQHVIMLNDTPDGDFPTGNPDPTEPNRLAELQQAVIVNEADMGLAFDGDGDRLMIVDNRGKVVTPDHLLYLLAQVALTERSSPSDDSSAPQVLYDIKCSHHLPKLLTALGASPIMTRTGSSLLRQQLQTDHSHAIFAGELSGHFIFNDGYFIVYDDAMYAGLRLLHWLTHTAANLSMASPMEITIDSNAIETTPMTTNSWGELRPILPPYQLTDITRTLPRLVSTADHYLPLGNSTDAHCTIVDHLTAFCHHLQVLVDGIDNNTSTFIADPIKKSATTGTTLCKQPSCTCLISDPHITTAQAQQWLPVGTQLSCIDGIRLDFLHGFGVLRQSNTSHSLTVRFAGNSIGDLKEIQARFVALCRLFDADLA